MQLKVPSPRRPPAIPGPGNEAETTPAVVPGVAPAAASEGAEPARATSTHVGIVCVHGIGFQHPGQTLLEWTEPIATALVGWRSRIAEADVVEEDRSWPRDLIESSDVDLTGERPSYVTFRVPGLTTVPGAGSQRWTFTEAYWAAKVEPPTLRLLIDWTGREGVVGRVVRGILGRNAPPILRRAVEVAGTLWLGVFVSALTSLVLLGYAILRSILAILPIQAAKDFVTYGQGERFLVGWWGDARSLVPDPVQSATVRMSLDAAIADLRARGCERIVVIAHSGGTIVSYMTLSDPGLPARADTLITHGQAIELGRRLEDLEPASPGGLQAQVQPSVSRIRQVERREDLRVDRWRDFYGSHDPAPLSIPTDLLGAAVRPGDGAVEVTNLRSIRDDHGAYWSNDETFVLQVMAEIERAGNRAGGAGNGSGEAGPHGGAGHVGAEPPSRFVRAGSPTPSDVTGTAVVTQPDASDAAGVARRESRVAMRSLWGRLSLVGPLVAILLAAGIAGGDIDDAVVLDAPSDILAANYDALPFHELGASISAWVATTLPMAWQDVAIGVTRGVFFLLFVIAALWACIPVGGWSRLPRLAALADALTSAAVPVAAIVAVAGVGPVAGIPIASEFVVVGLVVLAVLVVSAVVYWLYDYGRIPPISSTLVSVAAALALLGSVAAVVVAFLVQDATRRWIVDAAFAVLVVRLVVNLGMWRWNAWDRAERQWFRGARTTASSRVAIYLIAVALGILLIGVVAVLGGMEAPLATLGVPLTEFLAPAVVLGGLALVIYLVVRDVSIAESADA